MNEEPKKRHVHKYIRVRLGNKGHIVFKCVTDHCTRYIRKELVIGDETQCWRCGEPIIMTTWHVTFKKPHCRECTAHDGRGAHRRGQINDGGIAA